MRRMMYALGAICAVVGVVAGVWVLSYYLGILGANVGAHQAKRTVTARVQQRVRTPEFAQAAYEQFFTDCNAAVAANTKIAQARERVTSLKQLPDDQFGQKATRIADAITDLTGLQQLQVETAARYNAAAAEYTRGQFLAASLPPRLDPPYDYTCQ